MNNTTMFYVSLGYWIGFILGIAAIIFFLVRAVRKFERDAVSAAVSEYRRFDAQVMADAELMGRARGSDKEAERILRESGQVHALVFESWERARQRATETTPTL